MPGGRQRDPKKAKHFVIDESIKSKNPPATCIHCRKTMIWQSKQVQTHLDNCLHYQSISKQTSKSPISASSSNSNCITSYYNKIDKKQNLFYQSLLAKSIILDNLPFNAFEPSKQLGPSLKRIISQQLLLPSPHKMRKFLLDDQYALTKSIVDSKLQHEQYINVTIDESTNITRNRVLNLCTNTLNYGAFYVKSEVINTNITNSINSDFLVKWAISEFDKLTYNNPLRINALITDTCTTQRALGKKLSTTAHYQHIFWIPCDSHGLQLLVGDVIKVFDDVGIMEKCQKIVSSFQSSPKLLSELRQHMVKTIGKQYSFTLSVITRWGTQKAMIDSVIRARRALQSFFKGYRTNLPHTLVDLSLYIYQPEFWSQTQFLNHLLQPITEAIKTSESDHSTILHVIARWKKIHNQMRQLIMKQQIPFDKREMLATQLLSTIKRRLLAQSDTIHILAYLINPIHVGDNDCLIYDYYDALEEAQKWIQRYYVIHVNTQENYTGDTATQLADKAFTSLSYYRGKHGRFAPSSSIWSLKSQPLLFWQQAALIAPELGNICMRLCNTPASSVPSERSFSILNLLHNKARNQLDPSRVDKLQYIYINERVLERTSVQEATQEDLVELEDNLISAGETIETNPTMFEEMLAPIAQFLEDSDSDISM